MFQRLGKILFIASIFAVSLTAAAAYQLYIWAKKPTDLSTPRIIHFEKGTRLPELAGMLEAEGIISQAIFFHLLVRGTDDYGKFQAGSYRFAGQVRPLDVVNTIRQGKSYTPLALQFTIPEGFTLRQIAERLAAQGVDTKSNLLKLAGKKSFIKSLGIDAPSLEGYLYPATYSFTRRPTAEEVYKEMVKVFFNKIPTDYRTQLQSKMLTLHQAVIFASLIELETLHDDERGKISEVIWRRLKDGSPLGIDAALIHGIKDYRGDITWQHLKDVKNPYNTRIHKGLPPGPIGSPSLQSLLAVLEPTNEGYYYYVLLSDGTRRHHFSRSLSEHNRHVKLLLDASKNPSVPSGP